MNPHAQPEICPDPLSQMHELVLDYIIYLDGALQGVGNVFMYLGVIKKHQSPAGDCVSHRASSWVSDELNP